MSGKRDNEPVWVDTAPDEWISKDELRNRADDLEDLVTIWIDKNAKHFDPFNWEGMQERYWKQKASNEAGLYLLHALNFGKDDKTPSLKQQIISRANDRRFVQLLLRSQNKFHYFVYPILYADSVNSLEKGISTDLEQVAERGEFWSSEWYAMRLLEFCHLCQMVGVRCPHDKDDVLNYSVLNHQPNIITSDPMDAYAITHDVMFYTDHLTDRITPAPYDISKVIRGLLLRYMAEDNCDIAIELLYAGVLQRQISQEMAQFVLTWVLEKTRSGGYVPGPDVDAMSGLVSPEWKGRHRRVDEPSAPWDYEYDSKQEEIWARNYHTNLVTGLTIRVLKRDWNKLNNMQMDHNMEEYSFRQEVMRLGQLLESLAKYDLEKGAQQMIELTDSPIRTEFPLVFQEAIDFLKYQRTRTGEIGYWTEEEILYTNDGNSRESFQKDLVKPITNTCQNALDSVERSSSIPPQE